MDRIRLGDRLAEAKRRVAEGEEHIERQRDRIVTLRGSGRSTLVAGIYLVVLEKSLSVRVADRDRLEAMLAKLGLTAIVNTSTKRKGPPKRALIAVGSKR